MSKLSDIRQEYLKGQISVSEMPENPIIALKNWVNQAIESKVHEPTAMNISTVGSDGFPSARMVLLKEIQDQGIVFFTNYLSQKGQEISNNPHVAVTFFWPELERQIRIKCVAKKLSDEANDEYFYSRPLTSQAGAIVSNQSSIINETDDLEALVNDLVNNHKEDIKRPNHWGGYLLTPEYFEFWHGRASRIHDRVQYSKNGISWIKARLSP